MRKQIVMIVIVLVLGLLMAACTPGEPQQNSGMEEKPSDTMME